jgi:hypothetical protein
MLDHHRRAMSRFMKIAADCTQSATKATKNTQIQNSISKAQSLKPEARSQGLSAQGLSAH